MKQNFIELITVPFQAGESKLFAISGQYFELIDATNPIDVLLSDVNGAQRGVMRSAEASFNLKNTEFATVQLTSATTQTIRFAYGTGEAGTRRAAGAVSIVGTVPVDVSSSIPLALNAGTIQSLGTPLIPNARNNLIAPIVGGAPQALFLPAENINGAVLLQGGFYMHQSSVSVRGAVIAKTSPPTSITDGDVVIPMELSNITGNSISAMGTLKIPQFIRPGLGLYIIGDANVSSHFTSAIWRFL